jgi:mitochondrial import inner membrane translocase subunit TIM16
MLKASPKILIQILITGTQILGKAFLEAGRQAVKSIPLHCVVATRADLDVSLNLDAKHSPQGLLGNDVAGVGNATSGSVTDKLTRAHRMTLDEARMVLNVKRGEEIETVLKVSRFLFGGCSLTSPGYFSITSTFSKLIPHHRLPQRHHQRAPQGDNLQHR